MKSWIKIETALTGDTRIERLFCDLGCKGLGIYLYLRLITDQYDDGCTIRVLHEGASFITSRRLIDRVVNDYDLFDYLPAHRHYRASPLKSISDEIMSEMDSSSRAGVRADTREPARDPAREPARAGEPLTEKEENRKEKREDAASTAPPQLSDREKEFYAKMQEEYPRVCQLREPMTYAQMQRLLKRFSREQILSALNDMENNPRLLKKSLSANLTCQKYISISSRPFKNA